MAYRRNLPKMARQQWSVALWFKIAVRLEILYGFVGKVWYGGGGQMTSEFIHEEISIMDYNGLLWTIIEGVGS